jgi:hypothetical protein
LTTGSSASFSVLPPKNNGYISTATEANAKRYDLTKIKFVKGTGLARANAATNRAGSFGGYTVSPTKRLRPFILPTQVHQEVQEKDVFSYVGTTSNVPTQSAIVLLSREDLIGSALFLFPANCAILKETNFPMGVPFDTKTKGVETFKQHLPDRKKYRLALLPIYWPIPNGEVTTSKGIPNEGTHDAFQEMGVEAHCWLTSMTDAKQGACPFNADLQTLASAARPQLDKIFPRLSQGIQLRGTPYVTLTAVSEEDVELCDDLDESVNTLRAELEALVHKINPPVTVLPSAPGNPIGAQIDCSTEDSVSNDHITSQQKMSRNIGKMHLLTMGYCPTEGPRLNSMTQEIEDIFSLGVKEMAESFNNIVHSRSRNQADSLDAVNRQTDVPDWRSTP